MNPLISVIIPIYNVERYLSKCLNSVINQTYKNIEIILINDGSTDDSLKIAQEFQEKDSRIKLYSQKNQGLSGARNTGLKKVTGDYITFIDSDDYVTRDYVSYLYSLLERNGFTSQLAICSLMDVYTASGKEVNIGNNKEYTLSGKECIKKMCYQDLVDTCAYAKLGSKDLYKGFTFPVGKLFEDIGSTYKLFEKCKTVECGFFPKYYYNIRKDSITTRSFSKSKLDLLEMTDQMADDVIQKYPDLSHAVLRRQVYARFSTLNQTIKSTNSMEIKQIRQELITYIMNNRKKIIHDKNTPKRDIVGLFFLRFGFPFYKSMWQSYLKFSGK